MSAAEHALDALRSLVAAAVADGVAEALRRPDVAAALRPDAPPSGLLKVGELAKALGYSKPHVNRLRKLGIIVSETGEGTPRFDLEKVKAALQKHANKPVKPRKRDEGDSIDVSGLARRAGLKIAGGAR